MGGSLHTNWSHNCGSTLHRDRSGPRVCHPEYKLIKKKKGGPLGVKSSDISLWEDAGNIERGLPNGGFTAISAACLVAVRLEFFCPPACLPCPHQSRASERAFSGWVYTASRSLHFPTVKAVQVRTHIAITTASLSVPLPIDPTVRSPQTGPKADTIEYRKTTPEKNRNKDKR